MASTDYEITNKILNNILRFEKAKFQIEQSLSDDKLLHEVENEKKLSNLFHVAHLLGINSSYREIESIVKSKKPFLNDPNAKLVINFFAATEFIKTTIKSNYAFLDINFITQLNRLLLNNFKSIQESKLRDSGEAVDKSLDDWSELRDLSVTSAYVRPRLAQVIDTYKQGESRVYPILNLGVFLYQMIRICPFVSGNKISILAACEYIYILSKVTNEDFLSIIKVIDTNEQEFVECWFKASTNKDTLTDWLELFTEKLAIEIETVNEGLDKKKKILSKSKDQPFLRLNERQLKILRYLQNIPSLKRDEYCEMMGISTMTAYRDLEDLVSKKLLKSEGKSRGTRYLLYTR
ncbi:MAG: DeoR family transcriptional regulator [bacterium]